MQNQKRKKHKKKLQKTRHNNPKMKSQLFALAIILAVSFDGIFAIPVAADNNHAAAIHPRQETMKEYGKMFLRNQFGAVASLAARSRLRFARSVEKTNCRKVCYGNSGKCVTVCM